MKRQMVKGLLVEGNSLKAALEAVGMASSSYYYRPSGKRKERVLDAALVADNHAGGGHRNSVTHGLKITLQLAFELLVKWCFGTWTDRHKGIIGATRGELEYPQGNSNPC